LPAKRKFTSRANAISGRYTWPELRFFDVIGETGFSESPLEIYHGKTSVYCALQVAVQCGQASYANEDIEIHMAGIDLETLRNGDGVAMTHHYGRGNYNQIIFTRMLSSVRYGLNHLNQIGVRWFNHSPILESRIEDLQWQA
jgi:hypothetical protein